LPFIAIFVRLLAIIERFWTVFGDKREDFISDACDFLTKDSFWAFLVVFLCFWTLFHRFWVVFCKTRFALQCPRIAMRGLSVSFTQTVD